MISRWLKYVAHGNDCKIVQYAREQPKSATFGPFWVHQVKDKTIVIGMPPGAWTTERGMYRRGDIRKAIPIVMGQPIPHRLNQMLCCVWTRDEDLVVPLDQMTVIPDGLDDPPGTETAEYEAAVLWNWIGHIMKQKTRIQKTGGLIKEFNKWLAKTDVVLPTIPS